MATMVKEKKKKKTKEKHEKLFEPELTTKVVPEVDLCTEKEDESSTSNVLKNLTEDALPSGSSTQQQTYPSETPPLHTSTIPESLECSISSNLLDSQSNEPVNESITVENVGIVDKEAIKQTQGVYTDVCHRLDIVTLKDIPVNSEVPIEVLEGQLDTASYLDQVQNHSEMISEAVSVNVDVDENIIPSAPMLDEAVFHEPLVQSQEVFENNAPTVKCIPLELVMDMFAGQEMAEVKAMSDQEEAIVEAGLMSGPEHPLVDLLSTFRCSLTAREQVGHKIVQGYAAADKERIALWKIEKRTISVSEKCACGLTVSFSGKYEYAELMKSRLPAAQLRLEGLLKEVQESACHYQHEALLTYYQIEELISETLQSSKGEIREALALVLHELRVSECAPAVMCGALRRWARALAGALLDARDPRPLLFLLHHLFRQSRSVRWAAPLVRVPVGDGADAARALALLARLLAGPALEAARECTEAENEEMWEELDKLGGGGAVSEGALRERDLLALLRAFPLRALAARVLLLPRADISESRPHEWRHGARAVARALVGARALLSVLRSAARLYCRYERLRAALGVRALRVLHAAAALHQHNKDTYTKDMEGQIEAELEALFVEGCEEGWSRPPCALLRPAARAAYCEALITHLHDSSCVRVEPLGLELSAEPCARVVASVARAAAGAAPPLAARLLDFLLQTALGRTSAGACHGACGAGARAQLPRLLRAQPRLHAAALHAVAELHAVEPLGPEAESLEFLSLSTWRPTPCEARAVSEDWRRRSPGLLPRLLAALRYTPHDGLSLETQLALGAWLCALPAPQPAWAWAALMRLRVHRSSWGLPLEAPPPEDTSSVFAEAYAVLSSSWGHSVPEICGYGVSALCRVARAQASVAAHALPLVMAAMACSPESVALTPQFGELTSALLAPAQSLAQWARGARDAAPELLLRRMLAQIEAHRSTFEAWRRALAGAALAGAPLAACDAVMLAARPLRDLQEAPSPEMVRHLVRNAQHAPLACEAALRAAHAQRELARGLFARLLHALHAQRARAQRIHVDNALKEIGSTMGSEELVIYQAATAALAAPPSHPGHLLLWRLLLLLYLQTPPSSPDSPPVGVAFFSGLIKSRTLAQLKKRLQDTMTFHRNEADTLKERLITPEPKPTASKEIKSDVPIKDVLTSASLADLTGESSDGSDSEETEDSEGDDDYEGESWERDDSVSDAEENRRTDINMMNYHLRAETILREYGNWLQAGERLRAAPHQAEVARVIPDAIMETAWSVQLTRMRPPRARDDDLRTPRAPPAPAPPPSPLEVAVHHLMRIPDRSHKRLQVPEITSPVDNVDFGNQHQLFNLVDKHLGALEDFAREWESDVERVATLDNKLWPLVSALRVRTALPPVARSCANKCSPVALSLQGCFEWRISEGVSRSIQDNRSSARTAIAKLGRARPRDARTVASLQTIARRVRSVSAATAVAERAWRCAGSVRACAPAQHALAALVDRLAERWLCLDGEAAASLAARWCAGGSGAQRALCGALLARCGAARAPRAALYTRLLVTIGNGVAAGTLDPTHAFSYLSKFDMSHEPESSAARAQMLQALEAAARRWGRHPAPPLQPLLELIGVQTAALTNAEHLPMVVLGAARAAAAGPAPPTQLAHAARAAAACAHGVPFDQLGNLLRELGAVWWEARSRGVDWLPELAPPAAALHAALLRAFVGAARALSYTPERVGWYAWSALQESFGAWVSAAPPGLPADCRSAMLRRFVEAIEQVDVDCPGCWEQLLGLVWEWALQGSGGASAGGERRAARAGLLAALAGLPWSEHRWPRAALLPIALQISETGDVQIRQWVADTMRGVGAAAWLRGADDGGAPLAALLALLAGPLPLHPETLESAISLPWEQLGEPELEQSLLTFFRQHHDPERAYHDVPQFRVFLAASGLCPLLPGARSRRALFISLWARAAAGPPLRAHAAAHARAVLASVDQLVSAEHAESPGELEELLERAVAPLGAQPAAADALPVWAKWATRAPGACLSAARALTAVEDFALLADAAASALLAQGGSWCEACSRLRGCAAGAAGAGALLARGRLHAAYALALLATTPPEDLLHDFDFTEHPVMAAVWVCALRRCAGAAAGALLARWAEPPRLALLRAVLPAGRAPTPQHRLLCRLALCIITPGPDAARACEAALGVAGAPAGAAAWARAPAPPHLPLLAAQLFPGHDHYFAEEIRMANAD